MNAIKQFFSLVLGDEASLYPEEYFRKSKQAENSYYVIPGGFVYYPIKSESAPLDWRKF